MKEKDYINEKSHLATEKKIVLQSSLKNQWTGGPDKLRGVGLVGESRKKIEKLISVPSPFIRHLRVTAYLEFLVSFSHFSSIFVNAMFFYHWLDDDLVLCNFFYWCNIFFTFYLFTYAVLYFCKSMYFSNIIRCYLQLY